MLFKYTNLRKEVITIKAKVINRYVDKYSKKTIEKDTIIEVNDERAKELKEAGVIKTLPEKVKG